MSFQSLLNQIITHYPKTSLDKYGRETFGTTVEYNARVQEVTKNRFLANGDVVVVDAVVMVEGAADIDVGDKVTYSGTNYKVFTKKSRVDGNGNTHHFTLELQKWQV